MACGLFHERRQLRQVDVLEVQRPEVSWGETSCHSILRWREAIDASHFEREKSNGLSRPGHGEGEALDHDL